jgi:hypothetical protein
VEVRIQLGHQADVYDWRLYLRETTVRRLNRKRNQGQRLSFRSKYRIVQAILADLRRRLPARFPVYVLFDRRSVFSSVRGTVGTSAPSIFCAPICLYRHSKY